MPDSSIKDLAFLRNGGEMGALIRAVDWSANPLGHPESWAPALRHAISILLNSNTAMSICWGENFLELYNDAYRPLKGETKHLDFIGASASVTYTAIWQEIAPMFERARSGEPDLFVNYQVRLNLNGSVGNCYYDLSFTPICDDGGAVLGILIIANENLDAVLNQRNVQVAALEMAAMNEELLASNKELKGIHDTLEVTLGRLGESEERFRNLICSATLGIILLIGKAVKVEIVNDAYARLIGRSVLELTGHNLFEIIPEAESEFRPIIDSVRETGTPVCLFDQPYQVKQGHGNINVFLNLIYQPHRSENGVINGVMVLCQEVTDQVKARQLLGDNENRFRFLLNALPQQVWTATAEGALNYVNQVVTDDFGYNMEMVEGYGWQEFVHPDDLPKTLKKWTQTLESGHEYQNEFRLKFADGNYYWHLARAVPFFQEEKITLWLGTNTNIHQQKAEEHKKDEFISIASHELKTPLTSIKAFFQLTKREITANRQLNVFLEKAERQMDRLERLISDLLDVSKINAGQMIYNKAEFDVGKVVTDVVEGMQQITTSHTIELVVNDEMNYTGDQHRIEQVIINLLSNAIKYSPASNRILVKCELEDKNIVVSVQDFGIGIPEENLKDLFNRFYRVENTSSRFQGLGLGLFISAEIVKRHGGSFWIESQVGEGSTFFFLLPLYGQQLFNDIATDERSFYEGSFITIRYQPDHDYLDVDWIGYQNYDSVVKGCQIMLDLMQKCDCKKVLNNNTKVKGNWSEASDWGSEVWFPAMAKAGLRKFAWIYSPSAFSRISSNKSVPPAYNDVQLAFFDEKSEALNWLLT